MGMIFVMAVVGFRVDNSIIIIVVVGITIVNKCC